MTQRPEQRPPQQARSRETLQRMLNAAETVLERRGLEGATLPRIAAEAGLAPASVYRRFRDKEALIRAVFARFAELNARELEQEVDLEAVRKLGLRRFARQWIAAMIQGYRTRTGLIRAAVHYSQRHPNKPFVRRKQELEIRSFRRMAGLFLLWRGQIRHSNPERAVSYAMVMVALALRELILFDQASLFEKLVPVSDERLLTELPRMFLGYLGIDDRSG